METEEQIDDSTKSGENITILVVDNNSTWGAMVAATLNKFKYKVETVKHADDALCTLRVRGGEFDLVISDVHMPGMNGFELQRAIAEEFDNLPVVLMSADEGEGVALKGMENGAASFICKPVGPDDVKDLWQFAASKKKSRGTIHEEKKTFNESLPSPAVNEDKGKASPEDSKKKPPSKEGSDAKKEEASQSGASQKKAKVIWTNSLHNRFLGAIRSIGLDRAVPKKILEVMNVPGLTRENVASHLQKYRIFLRRVSDASCTAQYPAADHKRSSRHLFMSSSSSTLESSPLPTTLALNKFPYQRLGGQYFSASPNSLINQSGIFRQPRLMLPDRGSLPSSLFKLNLRSSLPSINLEGLSTTTTTTTTTTTLFSSSTPLTTGPSTLMNQANTNYNNITTPPNYVGYSSISNLKCLTGSSNAVETNINVDDYTTNIQVEGCDNSAGQLSNVIGDYGLSSNTPNVGNNIPLTPYMYELEALLAPQPSDQGNHFDTSLWNQVNILNQAQPQAQPQPQRNEGGTFTTTGNFYGNMSQWNHPSAPPSFNPAPNQQQYCSQDSVKPQEFGTSSGQLNNTMLLPPNQQDVRESFTNNASSQLHGKTLAPAVELDEVDEYLESLLAPFGDVQTLEGI